MTSTSNESCLLCTLAEAADGAGDGGDEHVVHRMAGWWAGILPGYEAPGWLVCALDRHAEGPDRMEPPEAAGFGPFVQRVSEALREVTGAERLYFLGFGEEHPHLHFMLVPRPPLAEAGATGVAYVARRAELVDRERAALVAASVRQSIRRRQHEQIA